MAQELATKSEDLSLIPRIHVVERANLLRLPFDLHLGITFATPPIRSVRVPEIHKTKKLSDSNKAVNKTKSQFLCFKSAASFF